MFQKAPFKACVIDDYEDSSVPLCSICEFVDDSAVYKEQKTHTKSINHLIEIVSSFLISI
mgnify:CR=1 FL=1